MMDDPTPLPVLAFSEAVYDEDEPIAPTVTFPLGKGTVAVDVDRRRDPLPGLAERNVALRVFILRLLDPEDLGHAVSPEVRAEAGKVLGA